MFAGGIAGAALTTGSVLWLAVESSSGWDGKNVGYALSGVAAVITALGGLILAFRPRRDATEERLLELLTEKIERDEDRP